MWMPNPSKSVKLHYRGEAITTRILPVQRGMEVGTEGKTSRVNWGPSGYPAWSRTSGEKIPVAKTISHRRRMARGSDEAIVSDDPAGQHNRTGGKGLWTDALIACDRANWAARP